MLKKCLFDKSHTLSYIYGMFTKNYEYSVDKNQQLINKRHISFEEIIAAINNGQLLDIIEQPNPNKYPNQKMYIVRINDYVYLVPFVIKDNHTVFLKTIFPNRKANKLYLKNEVANENEK